MNLSSLYTLLFVESLPHFTIPNRMEKAGAGTPLLCNGLPGKISLKLSAHAVNRLPAPMPIVHEMKRLLCRPDEKGQPVRSSAT
jgi:hypothetical protein